MRNRKKGASNDASGSADSNGKGSPKQGGSNKKNSGKKSEMLSAPSKKGGQLSFQTALICALSFLGVWQLMSIALNVTSAPAGVSSASDRDGPPTPISSKHVIDMDEQEDKCPIGQEGCPCTNGGYCDAELICTLVTKICSNNATVHEGNTYPKPWEDIHLETWGNDGTSMTPAPYDRETFDTRTRFYSMEPLSQEEFKKVRRQVMRNVTDKIKLQADIAARYMDEMVYYTPGEENRTLHRRSAIRFYHQTSKYNIMEPWFQYRIGFLHWHLGEFVTSIKYLTAALLLNSPPLEAPWTGPKLFPHGDKLQALIYLMLGKCEVEMAPNAMGYTVAKKAFERAVRFDPYLAAAHLEIGEAHMYLENFEQARTHLLEAMLSDPYNKDTSELLSYNDWKADSERPDVFERKAYSHGGEFWHQQYGAMRSRTVHDLQKVSKDIVRKALSSNETSKEVRKMYKDLEKQPYHMIFCMNTGRSGSHFLATLLRTAKGNKHGGLHVGFHEPMPQTQWNSKMMMYPAEDVYIERMQKVDAIIDTLQLGPPGATYSETSLNFVTSFYDIFPQEFRPPRYKVTVIHQRRDLAKLTKSFIEVGWFDEEMRRKGESWHKWTHFLDDDNETDNYTKPNRNSVLQPLAPRDNLTKFEKVLGYLIDTEARSQKFAKDNPHIQVVEVNTNELRTEEQIRALFDKLDLVPTPQSFIISGNVNNKETSRESYKKLCKKRNESIPSLERCSKEVVLFRRKYLERGMYFPELPHYIMYHEPGTEDEPDPPFEGWPVEDDPEGLDSKEDEEDDRELERQNREKLGSENS